VTTRALVWLTVVLLVILVLLELYAHGFIRG
jgi:hypothetical protein